MICTRRMGLAGADLAGAYTGRPRSGLACSAAILPLTWCGSFLPSPIGASISLARPAGGG
jgi:hypothetical protein